MTLPRLLPLFLAAALAAGPLGAQTTAPQPTVIESAGPGEMVSTDPSVEGSWSCTEVPTVEQSLSLSDQSDDAPESVASSPPIMKVSRASSAAIAAPDIGVSTSAMLPGTRARSSFT